MRWPPFVDIDLGMMAFYLYRLFTRTLSNLKKDKMLIPYEFQYTELADGNLTERQRQFTLSVDDELRQLGYLPLCAFRIGGFQPNIKRVYTRTGDPTDFNVLVMETETPVEGQATKMVATRRVMTFVTKFADGQSLETTNFGGVIKEFEHPGRHIQRCPNVGTAAALKEIHERKVRTIGSALSASSSAAEYFENIRSLYATSCQENLESGKWVKHPGGNGYAVNDGVLVGAMWRSFNLFATAPLKLISVLTISVLPALVTYAAIKLPSPIIWEWFLPLVFACVIAGVGIGLLLDRQEYFWAMLLTYVGIHVASGWAVTGPLPFCTIAGAAALQVSQWRKRRQLMIVGETVP